VASKGNKKKERNERKAKEHFRVDTTKETLEYLLAGLRKSHELIKKDLEEKSLEKGEE
jgi:hypothetical protein